MKPALLSSLFMLAACTFTHAQMASDVREAWKKLAVPRIEYKYQIKETLAREGRSFQGAQQIVFVFDDPKYMATIEGRSADPTIVTARQRLVYDGVDFRQYYTSHGVEDKYGMLVRESASPVRLDCLFPVMAAHSPEQALIRWGVMLGDVKIVDRRELVDGANCICLVKEGNPKFPTAKTLVFLDPERHYALIALRQSNLGRPVIEMQFTYRKNGDANVLQGYRLSKFGSDGTLESHDIVRVQQVSLPVSVDPAVFAFEYPEGTFVQEMKGRNDSVMLRASSGQLTVVTEANQGEPLVASEPTPYLFMSILIVVVVVLVAVSLIIVKARQHFLF